MELRERNADARGRAAAGAPAPGAVAAGVVPTPDWPSPAAVATAAGMGVGVGAEGGSTRVAAAMGVVAEVVAGVVAAVVAELRAVRFAFAMVEVGRDLAEIRLVNRHKSRTMHREASREGLEISHGNHI